MTRPATVTAIRNCLTCAVTDLAKIEDEDAPSYVCDKLKDALLNIAKASGHIEAMHDREWARS